MKNVLYYFAITLTLACGSYIQSCSGEDFDEPWQGPELETKAIKTRSGNEVTYTFPHRDDIAKSQAVIEKMDQAWSMTLQNATSTHRKEYGFYIYVDHSTGTLTCGPIVSGDNVSCGETGTITLGHVSNGSTVCACFHTHTPLDSCSTTCSRETGSSGDDEDFAVSSGIPGLLYDYRRPRISNYTPRTVSKKLYKFGPKKRKSFTTTE